MTLEEFNLILKDCHTDEQKLDFVQKNLFHGTPFVFKNRESEYFDFCKLVSNQFAVDYRDVFIVGSAKLGFSYVKSTPFSLDSDIDVVIVSDKLFEEFNKSICEFQYNLDRFRRLPTLNELELYHKFLKYFVKGWMRPDLLPVSFQMEVLKSGWFDFFRSISSGKSAVGNYNVAGGLFKNHYYLEKYHVTGVSDAYKKLIS